MSQQLTMADFAAMSELAKARRNTKYVRQH
jgi:hypothetical protein